MASGKANRRWKVGSSDRFSFLRLKNHCWCWLWPWNQKMTSYQQESYDKPRQCIKKQRHYSANKGPYSQGYSFPNGHVCESWTFKKAESQRIDAFELWCWRRLLKVPWTAWRPNQLILREINPEYSLEALILTVFWPSDAKRRLIGKVPDTGKDWRQKEKRASSIW